MNGIPEGWDGILDDGERILWQGRPDGAITLRAQNLIVMVFGLVFAGFALFWMIMASQTGGLFWMFGLVHFSVGAGIVFGAVGWNAFRRRRSWYTLTDRRAFVATDLPLMGRRLKSYPITADTVLVFEDGPLATVNFASATRRGKSGTYQVPVGFERIAEGREVYRMMRDIQARAQTAGATERFETR